MAEPLRHRQTKEAETDMFYLKGNVPADVELRGAALLALSR
jgi:hypothetical protein